MGEELNLGILYIQNDDGSFSEISRITEVEDLRDCSGYFDSDIGGPGSVEWFTPELIAKITLSDKQQKEFVKAFLKEVARSRRIVRRYKRLKEKIRRNMLKGGS